MVYVHPVLAVLYNQVDLMDGQWSEVKCFPETCVSVPDVLPRSLTDALLVDYIPPDIHIPSIEIYDTGVLDLSLIHI